MSDHDLLKSLERLFVETGPAHHQAFIDSDGADPEWPLWYAEFLHPKLTDLLSASFTKSELVYLLVTADREQAMFAPGTSWSTYYAFFFAERYG